jgi:hypothetical protein
MSRKFDLESRADRCSELHTSRRQIYFHTVISFRSTFCVELQYIYTNQKTQFNFTTYFYLHYIKQHVSASNPVIFREMFWIQQYSC